MARMVKIDKDDTREKYSYLAYPKKLDRIFQKIVIEEAAKYGIESVKDLMKNVLMDMIVYYEKKHRYIEARDWAAQNWQKNRFGDTTASNVDQKLDIDNYQKALADELKHIEEERNRINALLKKIPI